MIDPTASFQPFIMKAKAAMRMIITQNGGQLKNVLSAS